MKVLVMSHCSIIVCVIFVNVAVFVLSSNAASGFAIGKAQKTDVHAAGFQAKGFGEVVARGQRSADSLAPFQSHRSPEGYKLEKEQTSTNKSIGVTAACDHISISNSRYQRAMHGTYEKLASYYDCAGRQSYRRIGTSAYTYIFYLSYGAWGVGPTRCIDLVGIAAFSVASSPDKVTSTWLEYDGSDFVYSYSIQIGCDYSWSSGIRVYARLIPVIVVAAIILITWGV